MPFIIDYNRSYNRSFFNIFTWSLAHKINGYKWLFTILPLILDYYRLCNSLNLCEFGTVLI